MTKGKSVVVAFAAVMCAGACLARPCGPGHHGGWHRPPPIHHGWHGGYNHHGGYWGRGGCHFWPGFVGGVVGGVVGTALTRPYYSETRSGAMTVLWYSLTALLTRTQTRTSSLKSQWLPLKLLVLSQVSNRELLC